MNISLLKRPTPATLRKPPPRFPFRALIPFVGVLVLLLLWEIVVRLELYPAFIIPSPAAVWGRFTQVVADGSLFLHVGTTLAQMLAGLAIGVPLGILAGYGLAKSQTLETLLSPIVLAMQSTPVVAYAPLLIIWFGTGITSKIIICALIVFFPMLINTMLGIRAVPTSLRDLMRALQATRWQQFTQLELPSALPILLSGLKVSATLAVIGAVVGEFIVPQIGLGSLILEARGRYDTPLQYVAVLVLAALARTTYGLVALLETWALRWQRRGREYRK